MANKQTEYNRGRMHEEGETDMTRSKYRRTLNEPFYLDIIDKELEQAHEKYVI